MTTIIYLLNFSRYDIFSIDLYTYPQPKVTPFLVKKNKGSDKILYPKPSTIYYSHQDSHISPEDYEI